MLAREPCKGDLTWTPRVGEILAQNFKKESSRQGFYIIILGSQVGTELGMSWWCSSTAGYLMPSPFFTMSLNSTASPERNLSSSSLCPLRRVRPPQRLGTQPPNICQALNPDPDLDSCLCVMSNTAPVPWEDSIHTWRAGIVPFWVLQILAPNKETLTNQKKELHGRLQVASMGPVS